MKKLILFLIINLVLVWVGYGQSKTKTVMLVLGSSETDIIKSRIQVALRLFRTEKVDKIIVSGGCGAHASSICEASEMSRLLIENDVPEKIIYKEENSKTTAQNYVYSRSLRDESGEIIIQRNDLLFVVSDHWHAIAVAARFKKHDGVNARFFIEGDIEPKATDPLDYVGIFNKIPDNADFILKSTWPTPSAAFSTSESKYLVFPDRMYMLNSRDTSLIAIKEQWPALTEKWTNNVDAMARDEKKKQLIWFKGEECLLLKDEGSQTGTVLPLNKLIRQMPDDWKYLDAALIIGKDLYIFTKDQVLRAGRSSEGFKVTKIEDLKTWVPNWPYTWGGGDVTAADYDERTQTVFLYKNREVLKFNLKQKTTLPLERLKIKWQDLKK